MVGQMTPGSKYSLPKLRRLPLFWYPSCFCWPQCFGRKQESAFVSNGLTCMKIGLMYSMTTAFLVWILLRREPLQYPKLNGRRAGGFTGFVGLSVLESFAELERGITSWCGIGAFTLLSSLTMWRFGAAIDRLSVSQGVQDFRGSARPPCFLDDLCKRR